MLPNESEIGHFAGFQLQLELIGNQRNKFGIGGITKKDNPKEVPPGRNIPTLPMNCLSRLVYR